jgi:V/A-type H+-transporting ATPase subunit F
MSTSEVAVIGDKDSILCFKAVGANVFPVKDSQEAEKILKELIRNRTFGVVFVTEEFGKELEPLIESVSDRVLPSIVLIPGRKGTEGIGMQKIQHNVIRAVGADIMLESEGNR